MPLPLAKPATDPHLRFVWAWLGTIALTGGVLFPLGTLAFLTWSNGDPGWTNELYQRKIRFLEARPSSAGPRLLIFGGSASAFGLDAEMVEKELQIQTVNFATHAGLGLDYHLSQVKRQARAGDAVLLCLEMENYGDEATPNETLREHIFSYDKRYLFSLEPPMVLRFLFLNAWSDYQEALVRWNDRLTDRGAEDVWKLRQGYSFLRLSPNGDIRALPPKIPFPAMDFPDVLSAHAMASLAELDGWRRKHGIRLLFAWPNHVQPPSPDKAAQFHLHAQVADFCQKHGIPVAGSPEESVYPQELFFDSSYHVGEIGRRIRTQKLLGHLREIFTREPPTGTRTVCAMASDSPTLSEHGILEKGALVEYKYLSESRLPHPDCITPGELRELARAGTRVVCMDDATEAIAARAGVGSQELRRLESSFGDWIQRYGHHIFLLALVGTNQFPAAADGLPKYFAAFASEEGYRTGMIGTGRWTKIHRISRGTEKVEWFRRRYDPLAMDMPFHLKVALRSGPLSGMDEAHPPILVEGEPLSDLVPGLAVAVIDPELGIVVAQGTFATEPIVEWKLRQLVLP